MSLAQEPSSFNSPIKPPPPVHNGNEYGSAHVENGGQMIQGNVYGNVNIHQQLDTSTKEEQQCLQSFKTCSYETQKDRNPSRADGTCRWVLDHQYFRDWRVDAQHPLLWISADPGCGKSVLSKALADDILSSDNLTTVCYFFFKDNEEQDNLATAFCALLHQIFSSQPGLLRHAMPAWKKNGAKLQNEIQEMWRILRAVAADLECRPIICILDALDECRDADRQRLIQFLCDLQQSTRKARSTRNSLKILVTSRPYDDVRRWFGQTATEWPQIRLRGEDENETIRQEINIVVEQQVQALKQEHNLPKAIYNRILQSLQSIEHRTYLWLHLAIEEVRRACRDSIYPEDIDVTLLPESVDEAYEQILGKIDKKRRAYARLILLVIVGARRPLSIEEMAQALSAARAGERQSSTLTRIDPARLREQIPTLCGLFVFINHSQLFLIHQTAKEFLIAQEIALPHSPCVWKACLPNVDIECEMTMICVTYLHLLYTDQLSRVQYTQQGYRRRRLPAEINTDAFWHYCAEYWTQHLSTEAVRRKESLLYQIMSLVQTDTVLFSWWFPIMWKAMHPYGYLSKLHSYHVAALTGHTFILQHILKNERYDTSIDVLDRIHGTPLLLAAQQGHVGMVRLLLEHGADVNARGGDYGSALQAASARGHEAIVRLLLLEHGVDVNARGGHYGSALQAASRGGHEAIVRLLLEHGADVNAQGGHYGSALQAASEEGHEAVVRLLLGHGADVNPQGRYYGNALQAASAEGHGAIVRLLLEHGADVNARGGYYGSALQAASAEGHEAIVRLLLEHGADVNARGGDYGSALQAASARGHEAIVRLLLLEHGVDVNAQGGDYGSALQAASRGGHEAIVRLLLLEHGADVNAQGGYYGSALQAALVGGHEAAI